MKGNRLHPAAWYAVKPIGLAMNIRHTFLLAVSIGWLLGGCATQGDEGKANEAHVDRLMRHHSWPLIRQIAKAEVEKREMQWPGTADYLPVEHKDKVWLVMAMTGTPNGDVERSVSLTIGDDGAVLSYERHWSGER